MEVQVLFFGVLSEITGTKTKYYLDVKNTADLKFRIFDDYPEIVHYDFGITVNNEEIREGQPLCNKDKIALFPSVIRRSNKII
jgi:hypothetical protein